MVDLSRLSGISTPVVLAVALLRLRGVRRSAAKSASVSTIGSGGLPR